MNVDGFEHRMTQVGDVKMHAVVGGSGPPLVLIHGFPQTWWEWRHMMPQLAAAHTVVAVDLRGAGHSDNPRGGYDKAAHDRGARVGYRLALDHPSSVLAYVSLAVVPTLDIWPALDREFAKDAFHWFLFLQPGDLAERLLAGDPDACLDETLRQMIGSLDRLHPAAIADYRAAFRKSSVRAAMVKDYRAGYGPDTDNDAADRAAGRKLKCPVLVLWADERLVAEGVASDGATAVDVWRRWADDVSGFNVPGGHLIAEDASEDVLRLVPPFLQAAGEKPTLGGLTHGA